MKSKNSTCKKNFYLLVLEELNSSTNLKNIQDKLSINKQKLNYYIRQLKIKGLVIQKGRGWYEVVKNSKNSTKYGSILKKDSIRGHGYIWNTKIDNIPSCWENRVSILKRNKINYKLVGAKGNTPRVKVLGRKVWLCNDHLRIFDKKDESYYGDTAKDSRLSAFRQIKLIVNALNNKLGLSIKPSDISFQREHYALIKNDLAIEENRRGNIIRVSDDSGEWLLVDDSLGKGGELENIGKKALGTNIPMQRWWNDNKKHNFEVTPSFILKGMNNTNSMIREVTSNQLMFNHNFESHISAINTLSNEVSRLGKIIDKLQKKSNL